MVRLKRGVLTWVSVLLANIWQAVKESSSSTLKAVLQKEIKILRTIGLLANNVTHYNVGHNQNSKSFQL